MTNLSPNRDDFSGTTWADTAEITDHRSKSRSSWKHDLRFLLNKGHLFVGYAQALSRRLNSRAKFNSSPLDHEVLLALEEVAELITVIRAECVELEKALGAVLPPPLPLQPTRDEDAKSKNRPPAK